MPDDPRLRRGQIDRGTRFDAGVGEDEPGGGVVDDTRVRTTGEGRIDPRGMRTPTNLPQRDQIPSDVARSRNRRDSSRERSPAAMNGGIAPLTTAADARLDARNRTFAAEGEARARQEFRDDLGVRRNLSSTRRAGYRGTTEAVNLDPATRALSDWLDRTARGLDGWNDRLNGRAVGERIE
jgi:hypothetical protein